MTEKWIAQPGPQENVLLIKPEDAFEILFGGQRGGGKTDSGIVWLLGDEYEKDKLYIEHPRYRALIIRKNATDLSDWLDRALYLYKRYGAKRGSEQNSPIIRWPSGAKFRLGHLKDKSSYEKYLGHEYQRELIEELSLIPLADWYIKILGSCRSTVEGIKPQVFNTTNPGGPGHIWVKKRFIEGHEKNIPFKGDDGRYRVYIPSRLEDNPILMERDPGYVMYLEGLKGTDPDLYKAWREGDWNIIPNQFFAEFSDTTHTCVPFEPKDDLPKVAGADWGFTAPFVLLAGAIQKVSFEGIHFNRLWIYKEIDGVRKNPNQWSEIIKERLKLDQFTKIMLDPHAFDRKVDGSASIANDFLENDIMVERANNERVIGWAMIHKWLSIAPDGLPYMIFSTACKNIVETLPAQIRDENNLEDIDTESQTDHWADALRYLVMHVRWIDAGNLGAIYTNKPEIKTPRSAHVLDPKKFVE